MAKLSTTPTPAMRLALQRLLGGLPVRRRATLLALARRGWALCDAGRWYATSAGREAAGR